MEQHIKLLDEEIESLDNHKEICIWEDEDRDIKVFIKK